METLARDTRHAIRRLGRSPGFTVVTVLMLALGIGAATAIFSVVHAVLLRPLPFPESHEIVELSEIGTTGRELRVPLPNFEDFRAQSRSFDALARMGKVGVRTVTGGSEAITASTVAVSAGFFDVFDVEPVIGRTFLAEEQREGGAPAAIVSHFFWQNQLAADPDLTGRTLTFDDRVHSVVGVMPPDLGFPDWAEIWLPAELWGAEPSRTAHNWRVYGRLKEGVTPSQARLDVSAIAKRLRQQFGDDVTLVDATVAPLRDQIVGGVRRALLVLLGAAALLLLIACANVTSLLLARAAARRRELVVRLALGGSRRRLVREFLMESVVACLAGGALGVLLATWGVDALLAVEPGRLPRADEIGVNPVVLLFAFGLSLVVALALGTFTAVRTTRDASLSSLRESERTQAGGHSVHRARGALVASQIAMTLVLLIGAGLLGRSFISLLAIDPGYRTDGAVVMDLSLPYPQTPNEGAQLTLLHQELFTRLRAIPGVDAVGGVSTLPLSGGGPNGSFIILARPDEVQNFDDFSALIKTPSRTGQADFRVASDGYFEAMDIPLLRGRLFEERDAGEAPHVALISETLASNRWPDEDPIGKLIQFGNMDGDMTPITIVGVVGDIREGSIEADPRPVFYVLSRQRPGSASPFSIVIAGDAEPSRVIASARTILRDVAPDVPPRFRTLEEIFSASLSGRRLGLFLLAAFGTIAMVLAAMGIYGVISYLVAQQTQEIGIRMALGAQARDVVRMIVMTATRLVAFGLAGGIVAALVLTRLLGSFVFGIATTDPVTYVAVAVLLSAIALAAAYLPARGASRVSPIVALRAE
ncbi:MAG: ABC transporter permease [Gemmatimonadaceae bacterium]